MEDDEIEFVPIPIDWCRLCCDGRLPCVCGEPAFPWQREVAVGETFSLDVINIIEE
jgi:hypothetical protein